MKSQPVDDWAFILNDESALVHDDISYALRQSGADGRIRVYVFYQRAAGLRYDQELLPIQPLQHS